MFTTERLNVDMEKHICIYNNVVLMRRSSRYCTEVRNVMYENIWVAYQYVKYIEYDKIIVM